MYNTTDCYSTMGINYAGDKCCWQYNNTSNR